MNLKDQVGKSGAYQPGVVLVKFAKQVTEADAKNLAESFGYTLGQKFLGDRNWYRVNVPEGQEHKALSELQANKNLVVTAELNGRVGINPPKIRI
jgi:hypothetical protein